ncbi:DeoR family transcriptional regulator [Alteromonadaceae bacterium BrNp21-10]|nr:DeoR family transcriptional regulator [Alteromonadaceae bacterium BrNp21-10]
MIKRNTQQRRDNIISLLDAQEQVTVDELTQRFGTSEVTIRKDLNILENSGLLLRKHGGAVKLSGARNGNENPKISNRKKSIAKAAQSLINNHSRIIIDSGNTTAALIPYLTRKRGLIVMTNSLSVTQSLVNQEQEITVLNTGGTWDPQSHSFQGQMAEKILRAYNFDQAFVGATGLDIDSGTTTFNELTSLTRVMADVAEQVIVMAESSKLQHKIPNVELPWDMVSVLVTDDDISSAAKERIQQQGVKVICASEQDL